MHIFQTFFFLAPETDFFKNWTQWNVQMFIKVLDRPKKCFWVFQIKIKSVSGERKKLLKKDAFFVKNNAFNFCIHGVE